MTGSSHLRGLLPRTFAPFFGGFDGLREVQRRALPEVLSGRDVLIASATASGKTEAYAAPAAEIALDTGCAPATVLILSPTRALANDLKRRLESPMSVAGVSIGRYTGEHKERVGGALPAVMIATPEALDSLLSRRPETMSNVRLVVIDEVHVLDGTPRGDQLRVLLHRLDAQTHARPSRIAVSATMDDPEAFAGRYLRDAKVVMVAGGRRIGATGFFGKDLPDLAKHLDLIATKGARKVLVFCRSRNGVERYATKLRNRTRFADNVFAHHGSMSKQNRERTERLFLTAAAALCFSTMTLEMGIDIGSIDYVFLADAPSDVSSLLQRIGRGGRRGGETRFGYAYSNAAERHLVRTMTQLGAQGRLCGRPYAFRPSILAQQALVLTGSTYLVPHEMLAAVPKQLWPTKDRAWATELLESLVEAGVMERHGAGRYVLAELMETRFNLGNLHSNIGDTKGFDVVDRLTGDTVGEIERPESKRLQLGGSARSVEGLVDGRVLTDSARSADAAYFRPSMGRTVPFALARAVVEALGVPQGAVAWRKRPGRVQLIHGLGTVGARALANLLERSGASPNKEALTPYTLELPGPPSELPCQPEGFVESFLKDDFDWLERRISPGPWSKAIPKTWRLQATREGHGLAALAAFLMAAKLVELDPTAAGIEALDDL